MHFPYDSDKLSRIDSFWLGNTALTVSPTQKAKETAARAIHDDSANILLNAQKSTLDPIPLKAGSWTMKVTYASARLTE